jgi:hypothetical protein
MFNCHIYMWSKVVVATLKEVRTIKQLNDKDSVSKHYISVGYAAVRNKIGFIMNTSSIFFNVFNQVVNLSLVCTVAFI